MANLSNVVELPQATLEDVSKVLHAIAEGIRTGEYGRVQMDALVIQNETGEVITFGMAGGADFYRAVALFNMGIIHLMDTH